MTDDDDDDDKPMIMLNPSTTWCAEHLEPFRSSWPSGWAGAMLLVFTAFTALGDVRSYCGARGATKADANNLNAAVAEFSPMCCRIDAELLARIVECSLSLDAECHKALRAEILAPFE